MINLLQIFILDRIIDDLEKYEREEKLGEILGYLGVQIALFLVQIYVCVKCAWIHVIWKVQMKTIVQYLLFKKSLRTKVYSKKETGEEDES